MVIHVPCLRVPGISHSVVRDSQPAMGVFVMKRAVELSRQWGKPIFAAQLDLRKFHWDRRGPFIKNRNLKDLQNNPFPGAFKH